MDFQKAFDGTDQSVIRAVLESYGVDSRLTALLKDINENAKVTTRVDKEIEESSHTNRGTRQEDPISPRISITNLETATDKVSTEEQSISVHLVM